MSYKCLLKWSGIRSGLKRSGKAANVQIKKIPKTSRKPGKLLLMTTFDKLQERQAVGLKYNEMRGESQDLCTVISKVSKYMLQIKRVFVSICHLYIVA